MRDWPILEELAAKTAGFSGGGPEEPGRCGQPRKQVATVEQEVGKGLAQRAMVPEGCSAGAWQRDKTFRREAEPKLGSHACLFNAHGGHRT